MTHTLTPEQPKILGSGKTTAVDSAAPTASSSTLSPSYSNDIQLDPVGEHVLESGGNGSHDALGGEEKQEDLEEYPSGARLLYLFLALILCMLLAVIDMTITATAVPHITDEFHSLNDVGWYASVFFMTVASSQSTWGKIFRYFDLKAMFLGSIALFELGNLICGE
jgi:hypothetical protein